MANDRVVNHTQGEQIIAALNGIKRAITDDFTLQEKTASPSQEEQVVLPDLSYDGLSSVTIGAASLQSKTVTSATARQMVEADDGYYGLSEVTVDGYTLQSKSVTPTTSQQTITPDDGNDGLSEVTVGAIPSPYYEGVVGKDVKIGLINNFAPPYTKEEPSEADLEALRMEDGICNRWWLDLVTVGSLPQDVLDTLEQMGVPVPRRAGDEAMLSLGVVDWLGFNYYQPRRVQAPEKQVDENGNPIFSEPYIWKDRRMNESRGWEIYPKGIYDFGMKLKNEYPDLTFFISENGMGVEKEDAFRGKDGRIADDYRIDFVREHLLWVAKAIADGAKCVGYHYWAVIDNWSWNNAFKNRYGFVEVRLQDNYDRRLKKSADWLKEVIQSWEIE